MEVTASTIPDLDREIPTREVSGRLLECQVETLGYTQYMVDGEHVSEESIRTQRRS